MWKNNTGSRAPVGLWEHDNTTLKLVGAMSIMLVSGRGGGYKCGYLCTSKKNIASITWPFLDGWSTLRSSGHALYTSSWTASKVRRCWNEQLVKSAQLKNEPRGPKRRVYQANFQGRFVGLRDGMYFSNVLESNELGIIHQELVIKHEFWALWIKCWRTHLCTTARSAKYDCQGCESNLLPLKKVWTRNPDFISDHSK